MYISWQRCCCEDVKVIHDCGDPSYSVSETRWPELRAVGRHCVVCVFFKFDLWCVRMSGRRHLILQIRGLMSVCCTDDCET